VIRVKGNTFAHRAALKAAGGVWDRAAGLWLLPATTSAVILERLRLAPGVTVTNRPGVEVALSERPLSAPRDRNTVTVKHGDDMTYFNRFAGANPTAFFGFSSLSAMVHYVERIPIEIQYETRDGRNTAWALDTEDWYGTKTMQRALKLAREGWAEGADIASSIIEGLDVAHATRRRRKYGVAGGAVSVGRMLAGNPAHMLKRPQQPGRKIVTLFVESSMSSIITVDTAVIRAGLIAAIADVMEIKGYSCEIVATDISKWRGYAAMHSATVVKNAGEKLNVLDTVFALGHPSYLRRLQFACNANEEKLRPMWDTMGRSAACFDDDNPTRKNEFYIGQVTREVQLNLFGGTVYEQAQSMLPHIVPEALQAILEDETQ